MNFSNILAEIEKLDPEVYERTSPRRNIIKNWTRKVSLAALPFALGSLFNKAYGQGSTTGVINILNYALTLEYLERNFYQMGLAASNLIPAGAPRTAIETIYNHETAHVTFLAAAITAAGGTPVADVAGGGSLRFDFSAGKSASMNGPFADVFTSYNTFLAVAQTFEDTGVRAYKGQAGALLGSKDVLTAALQIHSVEARHAAHIRSMRRAVGGSLVAGTPKPWITGNQSNIASTLVQASYNGEDNTNQGGVDVKSISASMDVATESFDEPLDMPAVLAIVNPFIY
jgi:hypothetical protein